MVIHGNKIRKTGLTHVQFEGERIRLPVHIAEGVGLTGTDPVSCRLLVVTPGRYRLLLNDSPAEGGDLSRILREIADMEAPGDILQGTESNEKPAIRARLIDCIISAPPPGWRVNFPKEAKQLVSDKENRSSVFVFSVAGYVEIWFPDTLARAVAVPLPDLLS